MVRGTALILALVAASPALAQTTTCGPEFGKWVCHTVQPQQRPNIFQGSMDAGRQAYEQQQQFQRDLMARDAARAEAIRQDEASRRSQVQGQREMLEGQVAKFVREGRCDDAKATALQGGDMSLAEQAVRLCVAAP